MKKKYLSIIAAAALLMLLFPACELVFDEDTTSDVSEVSVKPVIEVLGEQVISMNVGTEYTDAGVEVSAGNNEVTVEIVAGEVDPNTEGFYLVKYEAENEYGWISNAYRSVLVHDGDPYTEDISGNYWGGNWNPGIMDFDFSAMISQHPTLDGYWTTTNAWKEQGVVVPLTFAENGDGTYSIVPYEHPRKGFIFGTVKIWDDPDDDVTGVKLYYYLEVYPPNGTDPLYQDHFWNLPF